MPTALGPSPLGQLTNKANMKGTLFLESGEGRVCPHQVGWEIRLRKQKLLQKNQTTKKACQDSLGKKPKLHLTQGKRRVRILYFPVDRSGFTLLSGGLLEATLRQSHTGLSNHHTRSSHTQSLSEGLVMGLSHKTKVILNDSSGEDLACNPDGKWACYM